MSYRYAASETEWAQGKKPSGQAAALRTNPCRWSTTLPDAKTPPRLRAEYECSRPQAHPNGSGGEFPWLQFLRHGALMLRRLLSNHTMSCANRLLRKLYLSLTQRDTPENLLECRGKLRGLLEI